jgi:hypothetical protein
VIDTRNGVANGHVTRVDPAVEQGTVNVEVAFDEALPKGARPDLSVDGTIELEHLDDVIYVGVRRSGRKAIPSECSKSSAALQKLCGLR